MNNEQEGVVEAKNLTVVYDNSESILKDISFKIDKGDFIFITGISGSGKTTLVKTLFGEIKPISGNLNVNGTDVMNASLDNLYDLRKKLGIVFQDYRLIQDLTVKENVAMPLVIDSRSKKEIEGGVEKLLSYVKILHKSGSIPSTLSGGEQQRASFARALVSNPDIILADEPTGNLDKYSARIIFELLLAANSAGKTVIVVTHDIPKDLDVSYRTFTIENGGLYEND